MLITCPSCAAIYDLPNERIGGAGRKVRCASCQESWFVARPDGVASAPDEKPSLDYDDMDVEIVAHPIPQADPDQTRRGADRGRGKAGGKAPRRFGAAKIGKVAALVVVCLAPPSLFAFRERVVAAMPGTASLYRSLGLPVNLAGLSFAKVTSHLSEENGTPILQVSGEIVNDGRIARTVPWLRISLEGEEGESLYAWSAKAAEGQLAVGRSAPFRVRLTAPPQSAQRVTVTFRDQRSRSSASLN